MRTIQFQGGFEWFRVFGLLLVVVLTLAVLPLNAFATTTDARVTDVSGLPDAPGYGNSIPTNVATSGITVTLSAGSGVWNGTESCTINSAYWRGASGASYNYGDSPVLSFIITLDEIGDSFDVTGGTVTATQSDISSINWTGSGNSATVIVTYAKIVPSTPTISWIASNATATTVTLTFTFNNPDAANGVTIDETGTDHIIVWANNNIGISVVESQEWNDSAYVVKLTGLTSGEVYDIICDENFKFAHNGISGDVSFVDGETYTHSYSSVGDDNDGNDNGSVSNIREESIPQPYVPGENGEIPHIVIVGSYLDNIIGGDIKYGPGENPFIQDGYTMIPVRIVLQSVGIPEDNIQWNENTKMVTISNNGNSRIVQFTPGSNYVIVNGNSIGFNGPPCTIKDNRVFLPFRALGEVVLGVPVDWDETTRGAYFDRD